LLLRIRKRHTAGEVSPARFCDVEFQDPESGGLDLAISVYRIDPRDLVQCHTEHYAGSKLDPKGRSDLDLDGLTATVVPVQLDPWPFETTAAAHCEIRCHTDDEVKGLAAQLFADLGGRTQDVSKPQMQAYVRETVAKADPEWTTYLERPAVKKTWRKLADLP